MNTESQAAVLSEQTGAANSAENVSLRPSSTPETEETAHIVEVSFNPSVTPFRESLNKPPRKPLNSERRTREFLTPAEIEKIGEAAQGIGRHGHRDATLILIAYRHALRVSELVSLR